MAEREISFVPFGEKESIKLTFGTVKSFIAGRTKSGALPSDIDIVKFMMLCKARELNPWTSDAYLVGYDSKDGPQFSLITSVWSLFKRAEANPNFDGIQHGVVIKTPSGEIIDREGDFFLPEEVLVGGWARCWRKDRKSPFYERMSMIPYDTQRSQWAKDPGGMISKVASAAVLREAFPTQLSGLYTENEINRMTTVEHVHEAPTGMMPPASRTEQAVAAISQRRTRKEPPKEIEQDTPRHEEQQRQQPEFDPNEADEQHEEKVEPTTQAHSPGWTQFSGLFDKLKNAGGCDRLLTHINNDNPCGLRPDELEQAREVIAKRKAQYAAPQE